MWRRIWILVYFAAIQMFLSVVTYAQEAMVSLPERIVLVALEKESPLINLLHEPATIKKMAVEQGYNIYEHDEATFIIPPDKKMNPKLFMMNQLLSLLPQSIYEKGSFRLSELTQEARDSFYSLFKDAATKIDDERAIVISIDIYASLPSTGKENAPEKIWVASLREGKGNLSPVEYAQAESVDNETSVPSAAKDFDNTLSMRALSTLDLHKEYTVSFHFNFEPSLDSALDLINKALLIMNEQNNHLKQRYRQLVQKVIALYLSQHQLQLGWVSLHAMPQPLLRSIEQYFQQKEKFPETIPAQIELQAQLYIYVPLRLSRGTIYFGIPLGGQ